jgi:ABC-type nitrate/sulfonate/bicarbonate transport system permease component
MVGIMIGLALGISIGTFLGVCIKLSVFDERLKKLEEKYNHA